MIRVENKHEAVREYAEAVVEFVKLARQPTSGGRMAAQVLLSAYNGFEFQLDVAGMGSFDRSNFDVALAIIKLRYQTGLEPHVFLKDGSRVFQGLWEQWGGLHVKERGKEECRRCDGRGKIYLSDDDDGDRCTECNGTGRVCSCKL